MTPRFFLPVLVACALSCVHAAPWFQGNIVGMEVGPTGAQFGHSDASDARYSARFDGREIVRRCLAAQCEYVVIWARDGDYAYYDSKVLPKPPGLAGRDPLRDAVDEARLHKLPVIAYCVVQQGGLYLDAHPDWKMRSAEGQPLDRFCLNSGYLEAMKAILAEQLVYGVDGFHIDMLDQGFGPPYGCWCPTCQSLFLKEYGQPMPKAGVRWNEDWDRMLSFRYAASERFEKALFAHVKALNPRVTVDFNYHGNPPFSFEVGQRPVQHAGNGEFITGETGMWGFSALTVGLNAAFYRAAAPGQPVQVAISRDARVYHNQTVRTLPDLRWELLTLLAHGAFVTVVDKTAFDGALDPLAYERVGQAFTDARARRQHFGQLPIADVALYFSSRTRDWVGRERPEDYFQGFLGAHKALVYEHIPWGVVLDENVNAAVLRQFPVVLLPNVSIVSDRELELLGDYVRAGGNLIVTGLSGTCDRLGTTQERSTLEPLTGARLVRKLDSLDNWVRFPDAPESVVSNALVPDGRTGWPFLVKGPAVVLEATSAAAVGQLLKPYRTVRQQQGREGTEWPMSPEAPVGPAVLLNRVGQGQVLTFAVSPDTAVGSEHSIAETRRLLRNAIRFLHPRPLVQINAPATVETVVTGDPASRQLRVHFIAYQAPPQTMPMKNRPYVLPSLIEDTPMFRASIQFRDEVKGARVYNANTEWRRRDKQVDVRVEDIHEVVTADY